MNIQDFRKRFEQLPQIDNTADQLQYAGSKIHWKGLSFSAKSICASQLAKQVPGNHLFVLSDKEEAAYFLNDLEKLG